MPIMTLKEPLKYECAAALGNFDGVHRGHKAVIAAAAEFRADGLVPCVLSFHPHTGAFFDRASHPDLITDTLAFNAFKAAGAREVYEISFEQVRNMEPEEFVREILVGKMKAKAVCCGFNYRFGKNGAGTSDTLVSLGKKYGFCVRVVQSVDYDGAPVSSTRIRAAVQRGEMREAQEMLGRPFSYDFTVVTGDRIGGAVLGFPTINQEFPESFVQPRFGVYAGRAQAEGRYYDAVINFGVRPTFSSTRPRSESHLINFSGDLYGKNVKVELLQFLRGEIRFDGIEGLIAQIAEDKQRAIEVPAEIDKGKQ